MQLGPVPPVETARATPWWAVKHNKSCFKGTHYVLRRDNEGGKEREREKRLIISPFITLPFSKKKKSHTFISTEKV